jgi:prolyl-tRNA editing enzyme YbaK/EbsC (Cys-tRNA(Pro) deacylase)
MWVPRCLGIDSEPKVAKPKRGVPPFGHGTRLRIFIDPDLLRYDGVNDFVWAAAGTWHDVFPIAPNDLVRASSAVVTDLKRG